MLTVKERIELKRLHIALDHNNEEGGLSVNDRMMFIALGDESSEADRRRICSKCSPDSW
jgi:hypothetical protein